MPDHPLYVAFLWHQHQPSYRDPLTGQNALPWVRLHATKDYYDMAALLQGFPQIRCTFNLVPSLLTQLQDYARGATDPFLDLTIKETSELKKEDKVWILHNFFLANWDTMILPHERYKELLTQRGRFVTVEELERVQHYFSARDMRDLQVWFNLAWMDPYWQKNDDVIRDLFKKGRDFTEPEKNALINKQREICGKIVSKHKELAETGQIEISTSPFYHPILPLLIDTDLARQNIPQWIPLEKRFRHPEDASAQLSRAVKIHHELFGRPPAGLWPSEGAVSHEVIPLAQQAGFRWMASDEEILWKTLPHIKERNALYQPFWVEAQSARIAMVFRDRVLSDAIGFVYAQWSAKDAVQDFVKRLEGIWAGTRHQQEPALVSVILDGENCWETYPQDGHDFLNRLYETLSSDHRFSCTTIDDFINRHSPRVTVDHLFPGSWINASFSIWIGHDEDRNAWQKLAITREFLENHLKQHPEKQSSTQSQAAWDSIYAAEGSDWTWWYGPEHPSENEPVFDQLFRNHLMNVYLLMGEKVPDDLKIPIRKAPRTMAGWPPADFIHPTIDGKVTSYFEWLGAGTYEIGQSGRTMHKSEAILASFLYGFDLENLYFRFDTQQALERTSENILTIKILFLNPSPCEALLTINKGRLTNSLLNTTSGQAQPLKAAAEKVIEVALPLGKICAEKGQKLQFFIFVSQGSHELERFPTHLPFSIICPSSAAFSDNWQV